MDNDKLLNSLKEIKSLGNFKYSEMRYYIIPEIYQKLKAKQTNHQHTIEDLNKSFFAEHPKLIEMANDISVFFENKANDLEDNLINIMDNKVSKSEHFTIALFGRTKAGKSTLHQALTNGSGDTIGKGSQRTTRNVKRYYWGNMQIIDTPGTSAYNGEEDEKVAYEVINEADLVLFLVTNDSIQESEFNNLKIIKELNKPVLIILNVKIDLERSVKRKKFLANYNEFLEKEKTGHETRIKNFTSTKWGLKDIPIIPFHAQAAFLSTQETDFELKESLFKASQLEIVKEKINELVNGYGKQFRLISYRDLVILFLNEIVLQTAQFVKELGPIKVQVTDAPKEHYEWFKGFEHTIDVEMQSCVKEAFKYFEAEIFKFLKLVESGELKKSKKELDDVWSNTFSNQEKILKNKIDSKIRFLNNQIGNEFDYLFNLGVFKSSLNINFENISFNKINKNIIGKLLILLPLVTTITGKLGPYGLLTSLGINILGTIAKKAYGKDNDKYMEKWKKLKADIKKSIQDIKLKTLDHVISSYKKDIYQVAIEKVRQNDSRLINIALQLGQNNNSLNKMIKDELLRQNKLLLDNIFEASYNRKDISKSIVHIVRLPGSYLSILTTASKDIFTSDVIEHLSQLLHENVQVIFWHNNIINSISDALQIEPSSIQQDKDDWSIYYVDPSANVTKNELNILNKLLKHHIEIRKGAANDNETISYRSTI